MQTAATGIGCNGAFLDSRGKRVTPCLLYVIGAHNNFLQLEMRSVILTLNIENSVLGADLDPHLCEMVAVRWESNK